MPWRLIVIVIVFAVFLAFIMFNLNNSCDINFGFIQIENVPVFLTIFISFILGMLCSLPFALFYRRKHKEVLKKHVKPNFDELHPEPEADDKIRQDAAMARKRFFSNRKSEKPHE